MNSSVFSTFQGPVASLDPDEARSSHGDTHSLPCPAPTDLPSPLSCPFPSTPLRPHWPASCPLNPPQCSLSPRAFLSLFLAWLTLSPDTRFRLLRAFGRLSQVQVGALLSRSHQSEVSGADQGQHAVWWPLLGLRGRYTHAHTPFTAAQH